MSETYSCKHKRCREDLSHCILQALWICPLEFTVHCTDGDWVHPTSYLAEKIWRDYVDKLHAWQGFQDATATTLWYIVDGMRKDMDAMKEKMAAAG